MKVQLVDLTPQDLKKVKVKLRKPKAPKKPRKLKDIRSVFREHLANLSIEKLKKPWMAEKAFRLITTKEDLWVWARGVVADKTRYHLNPISKQEMPVVAADTETIGLDTRIVSVIKEDPITGCLSLVHEVNIELAGVCLSADGLEGIYIPVNHEDGQNISREDTAEVLQWLFDQVHLVFYNAKFDREVIRICLGINLRGYPYFEDVQVIQYVNDPKADLGDKGSTYTGDSGGLKALSEKILGIEQIKGEDIMKIRADFCPIAGSAFKCKCTPELNKKHSTRVVYVPFTWIPTDIALWYAAGDAICTWLLWEKGKDKARSRGLIHRIDHELVESLTFIERQRFIIDIDRHRRTVNWHERKLREMEAKLRELAINEGYKEPQQADGTILENDRFSPTKTIKLSTFLFKIRKFEIIKMGKVLPSADAEVIEELRKRHPEDQFLKNFAEYKSYVALHPENLRYDPRDNSARMYLKQNVVAGGRLSGAGGDYDVDGGFVLNPQGIVRVEGNWWVHGNVLDPDAVAPEDVEPHEESELHPSCFKEIEKEIPIMKRVPVLDEQGNQRCDEISGEELFADVVDHIERKKVRTKAPGIINNHIANFMGYAICLVPNCETCAEKYGILINNGRMDANEIINIRVMMTAMAGWTFYTIDYSNIEMRAAANVSREPEFIKEFLEGKGDFHSLTASKVFPEFNDPNTPKDIKKKLRSLAKIINFALLYGGTEYTIFENMKKEKPDITWEEAKQMVAKYWEGVPVFAAWCNNKQAVARDTMSCTTSTGRVIYFLSAMAALGIHKPTEEELNNYWDYRRLVKKEEEAKKKGQDELAAKLKAAYDRLWKDQTSGVRNAQDYNRFTGKIQRVAVNVPLQGLAGDFMRISLNRIRAWVLKDPDIQKIFRLHCSVHDEIDFQVKNEYAPFMIPRITRLMKLRKYHTKMDWKVPIECDCEYGTSWDVEHHLTGDDGHKPAAWTKVPGMESYIPTLFDVIKVKELLAQITSGDVEQVNSARVWFKENLHARCADAVTEIFNGKDTKRALIAALQLHEYWTIDHMADEDEDKLETLAQYEARNGLTEKDRGMAPEFGYLGAVPLNNVTRPTLEILGKAVPVEEAVITVSDKEINVSVGEEVDDVEEPVTQSVIQSKGNQESDEVDEDEVIGAAPPRQKAEIKKVEMVKAPITAATPIPAPKPEVLELREMSPTEIKRFRVALGCGRHKLTVKYSGKTFDLVDIGVTQIPAEYLKDQKESILP